MVLPPVPSSDDFDKDPEVWEVVVVGAGVAGASLAYRLGKEGRRVLLLERDLAEPDRIVGELLQPGGYLKLKELGLEDAVEKIDAVKVRGYHLYKKGQWAKLKYPAVAGVEDVAGRSFHNGRFVQRLRQLAASCPNVTVRQATVKRLVNGSGEEWAEDMPVGGVAYRKAGEPQDRIARAGLTMVCDGMYSTLRTKFLTPEINAPSFFVGLILLNCTLPEPDKAVVILGDPSPILFYPISPTEVRCLVDVPGNKLPSSTDGSLAAYLREVANQMPETLRVPFLAAVDRGEIRSMQNKTMAASPINQVGALLLGDAFNMRHPLTGGGMTVALNDVSLLCDMLRAPCDFTDVRSTAQQTAKYFIARKPWAATINTLANALYKVFCGNGEKWSEEMRQACFDYLKLGGMYAEGPISLLSGLNPRPSVLVVHFFMVALFGVGRLLFPVPTPRKILLGFQLIIGAAAIILPIIQAEGIRAVFFPYLVRTPPPGSRRRASQPGGVATKAA